MLLRCGTQSDPSDQVFYDGLQEGNPVKTLPEHLSRRGEQAKTLLHKAAGRRKRMKE